jgi:hypothetical protein
MPIATPKPNLFALIGCEDSFCSMADFSLFTSRLRRVLTALAAQRLSSLAPGLPRV